MSLTLALCLFVALAYGQGRGKEPGKPSGEKPPVEKSPQPKPDIKPGIAEKPRAEQPAHEPPVKAQANDKPLKNDKPLPKEGAKAAENGPGGDWSDRTHGIRRPSELPGAKGVEPGRKTKTPPAPAAKTPAPGATEKGATEKGATEKGATEKGATEKGATEKGATERKTTPPKPGAGGAAPGSAPAKPHALAGTGAAGTSEGIASVRSSFKQTNLYRSQWFANHPHAWFPAGWTAGRAWTIAAWGPLIGYLGYGNITPMPYYYGDNVIYQNGNVLVDDEGVGTAADFSQQAADLVQIGIDAQLSDSDEWLPLGVFALVHNERQHPHLVVQFALNKGGILRGNYTDEVSGQTSPIMGSVDQRTQRAAWTVGTNRQTIMEAGLYNLTQDEAPILIHRNGMTEHWILIRLNNDSAP